MRSIADPVLAATSKLVHQALHGQWQDVSRTLQERRLLLEDVTSQARPQDRAWLDALKQAMAESDAAIAKMTPGATTPSAKDPCTKD